MEITTLTAHCLTLPGAHEEYKEEWGAWLYRVGTKMFALVSSQRTSITLKCDPVWAQLLRQTYPAVTPGYHMNKRHWNTVMVDGSIPADELREMVEHSHRLVVASLTKRQRAELGLEVS